MAMERSLRDQWVRALRSGFYKQGIGFLCRIVDDEPQYCCLGVLNEVLGTPKRQSANIISYYNDFPEAPPTDEDTYYAPYTNSLYLSRYGIDGDVHHDLIGMNDRGRSFDEIADWIERNVPVVHTDKCFDPGCPDHGVMTVNNGD